MSGVLFLLGTQSALLSTAKYGIISELVPRSSLSAVNGLVALVTLVAAIVGAAAGMELAARTIASDSLVLATIALELLAVVGVIGSLLIQRVSSANPTLGMVAVAGLFWLLAGPLKLSASQIFLVTGLGILPILLYVVWLLPQATVRFFVWLLSRFVYRVRIYDFENLPEKGPALLVANHVSWLDGVLLLLSSSRPIRMVAYADYIKGPWIGWLARLCGIVPIRSGDGPRALMQSLNTAREALIAGELVCIFAEGQITRNGQLQKFERGLVKILKGTDAPVIPVYLDEFWGSIFSYDGGKFLWKKPRHWPYLVSISFGAPIHGVNDVDVVRHAVLDLSAKSMERRNERRMIPAKQFIRECRVAWRRTKTADSAGTELTGGKLLSGSLALHKLLTNGVAEFVRTLSWRLQPEADRILTNPATVAVLV